MLIIIINSSLIIKSRIEMLQEELEDKRLLLDIYRRGEGEYPVFLEYQRSALPVNLLRITSGVMNSLIYLGLMNPILYSIIYSVTRKDIFRDVSYLRGWMMLQAFFWESVYKHSRYFCAQWLNALFLTLIFPITLL